MNKCTERLYNGLVKENPTLVLMLGMCPTLAVTTSAINGLGMGLSTTAVLVMSNLMISALRKIIPDKVRMPAFIVIVASFVTIVELLVKGFLPSLNDSLGIYIPLIVVNCIILGRAEAYASKNPVLPSIFDGIGMGLGFTCSLTMIGLIREIIGAGTAFGAQILPDGYEPFSIFVMAPGAFFVLAILTAVQNKLKLTSATNGDAPKGAEVLACGGTWMVKKDLIEGEKWDEITDICKKAVKNMLGLELRHIGINSDDEEQAVRTAKTLCAIFDLEYKPGNSSIFAGKEFEIMKSNGRGTHGHIAVSTWDVDRAVYHLSRAGASFDESTRTRDEKGSKFIYLEGEFGGFAIHLIRK